MKKLVVYDNSLMKKLEVLEEQIVVPRAIFGINVFNTAIENIFIFIIVNSIVPITTLTQLISTGILCEIYTLHRWKQINFQTSLGKKQKKIKRELRNLKLSLQKENVYVTNKSLTNAKNLVNSQKTLKNQESHEQYYTLLDKKSDLYILKEELLDNYYYQLSLLELEDAPLPEEVMENFKKMIKTRK